MSQLNESTVHLLATDPSVEVVRTLVLTDAFDAYASHDEVMAVIGRDTLIATSVAEKFEKLENVDTDTVVEKLLSISDPTVAAALAGNQETPRSVLRQLTEHPDPQVRLTAVRSLA